MFDISVLLLFIILLFDRFVLNLAISNFLMTVFIMPPVLISTFTYDWILGHTLCQITGVLTTLCFVSCIMTLLLISGDRYYAIMKPLRYNLNMTSRKASLFICGVWVTSLVVSSMPLIGWNHITYQPAKAMCTVNWRSHKLIDQSYSFFIVFICLVVPYAVMLWVYVTVFKEAKKTLAKHRKNSITVNDMQIAPLTSSDDTLLSNSSPPSVKNGAFTRRESFSSSPGIKNGAFARRESFPCAKNGAFTRRESVSSQHGVKNGSFPRRESTRKASITSLFMAVRRRSSTVGKSLLLFHAEDSRAAKTGLIIMFTFTLCWVPLAVLIVFEALLTDNGETNDESGTIPAWVEACTIWVALAGCALNPIVYVFRSQKVKQEIKQCLCLAPRAELAEQERRTSIEFGGSRRTSIINTNYIVNGRDSVRHHGRCTRNNSLPTLVLNKTETFKHVSSYPSIPSLSGDIV